MKKALIVEDDRILTLINKKYLQQIGCEVVATVHNAEAAIQAVRDFKPDFMLMDIRLEGERDGIDTVLEIRKFSDLAVIYISGNSEAEIKKRAAESRMHGFLIKPLDYDELRILVDGLQ